MLKLGGVVGLKVGLGQSTLVEGGELGELRPISIVPNLPSTKSCIR